MHKDAYCSTIFHSYFIEKAYNGTNNPQLYTFLFQSDLQNATPLGHFWFYIFERFLLYNFFEREGVREREALM